MIRLTQVNMFEAKTELSRLVKALETKEEDVIFLARNGKPVVQMTRIPEKLSFVLLLMKESRQILIIRGLPLAKTQRRFR